jgi:hypothetical protein
MNGCTLQLTRDSALRTVLVDQATGHAKYQIETSIKLAQSVTRIRKLDSPTHPHHHRDEDIDSGSGDDVTDKGKHKKKSKKNKEEGDEMVPELAETSDEMARIYWNLFAPDRIVFRGRITTRSELLPRAGKMGG